MQEKGICPVCSGSGRRPAGDYPYKSVTIGYDSATDTLPCSNCGGQYQYGRPSGSVRLNREGVPCTHSYVGEYIGRCYRQYICQHCNDSYRIDSGD